VFNSGLTDEQKAERLAELDAQQLELERFEELFIEQAECDGVVIARRADADPRAVLGVDVIEPQPVEPAVMEAA
jgi:hypothetical protein